VSETNSVAPVRVQARDKAYAQDISIRSHAIVADEPESRGGTNAGATPYEILLAALGACTSITLRMYAERKGWDVGAISVELSHSRRGETDLIERTLSFVKPITEEQRARLLEIAAKTPVTKTVMHGATVTTTITQ